MRALAACVIAFCSVAAFAQEPPPGWRFPTHEDVRGGWAEYRQLFPKPYHARSDFNGDGIPDDVWILISQDNKGSGVFVFLSEKRGRFRTIEVFSDDRSPAQSYALAIVPPGEQRTFCGRTGQCEAGELASVRLESAGFELITLGTAAGLYYWSKETQTFSSVTTAD